MSATDPIAVLAVLLFVVPPVLIVYSVGFGFGMTGWVSRQLILIFGLPGMLAVTGFVLASTGNAAENEGATPGMMLRALLIPGSYDTYWSTFGMPLWWGIATLAGTAALLALLASCFGVLFGIAQSRLLQQAAESS